jgi:hypothetical protein
MSLQERINNDIRDAMKAKNVDRLAALRAVKSAIMLEASKDGISMVSDNMSIKLISKLAKQRKDSAAIFVEQKREDLAADEISQLSYLEQYLPEKMGEEDVRDIVKDVIVKLGASSLSDISKCMGLLIERLNGKADGSLISRIVREELS